MLLVTFYREIFFGGGVWDRRRAEAKGHGALVSISEKVISLQVFH